VLEHAPPLVHQKGRKLTGDLGATKSDAESSSNQNEDQAKDADEVVSDKVTALAEGVLEFEEADEQVIGDETAREGHYVKLDPLGRHHALVRGEDALRGVVARIEADVE